MEKSRKINLIRDIIMLAILFCLLFGASSSYGQYSIGHTTINFIDSSRNNREIETEIYYPAVVDGDDVAAVQEEFPVIVFGHGFAMAWDAYENIWNDLVPEGYIMAFPRTEGNIFNTDHQRFGWDLQFLVERMQIESGDNSSILFQTMRPETALMGHSMGGGASFLAADSLCSNNNVNLKTIIGLAPAESTSNGVSSINSAKSINVPGLIFSGSQDGVTPPDEHHIPMYDSLASDCKTFVNIVGGAHCYFANSNFNCDFGEGSASNGISIQREEQQVITSSFLYTWLDYTLKGNCDAFDNFNDSLNTNGGITFEQHCYINPTPVIDFGNGQLYTQQTGIAYEWYLDNAPIANSNDSFYTPSQGGEYYVQVTYANGCVKQSEIFEVLSTRLDENLLAGIKLFPNPANDILIVSGYEGDHVELIGLQGKSINKRVINGKIDLSDVNPGFYIVKLDGILKKLVVN